MQETVCEEARGNQWGVRSIDKVQHTKRAICDFQRGAGRWASKSDHMENLCCDKINGGAVHFEVWRGLS